ncbi:hypothetical protein FVR03_21705 [Pontibacter qinzhouensis]|uniref:Uncharacterized protein n=1 Tax=Pontibacter qinzhouensis TaxID=2603253 RepID=A0A5C8J010_9BACT|nr:hypothetical protein [Pontibacter qinzhouensis]TXK26541.1 hypothetical protein FVR03_21705 [Pontibacter qinzhouensis]
MVLTTVSEDGHPTTEVVVLNPHFINPDEYPLDIEDIIEIHKQEYVVPAHLTQEDKELLISIKQDEISRTLKDHKGVRIIYNVIYEEELSAALINKLIEENNSDFYPTTQYNK